MRKYQKFLIGFTSIFAVGAIVAGTSVGLTNSLNYTISSESNNNASSDLSSWTTTFNNYAKDHYQNLVKTDLSYYCQNVNNYLQDNLNSASNLFSTASESLPFYTMYLFNNTNSNTSSNSSGYVYSQYLNSEKISMNNLSFNKNDTNFNVDFTVTINTTIDIETNANFNSDNPQQQTKNNDFTITLDLSDATIAPTIIDNLSKLINQDNKNITPNGGWFINHIGTLNWTEKMNYNSPTSQQEIINDITGNNFDFSSLITLVQNGTQTNINFINPSNSDYVSCPNTGLLNNIVSLYNLNFNQAINQTGYNGNYLSIQKATPLSNGGASSYWIANVFNNVISAYDIAVNSGKQTQLSQITNYDLYAINTSGNNITYNINYDFVNNNNNYDY